MSNENENYNDLSNKSQAVSESIPESAIEWSPENEDLLIDWCDVAQSYKWLCMRSHAKYSRLHAWFTIPAIIMSTISGTASFAQSNLPVEYQAYAPMVIGTINISISIFSTIQQYLKISELNESYRVSYIAWDKYARNLRIELTKHPLERIPAGLFLKHSREEFDRLMETSPLITDSVINEFKQKFNNKAVQADFKKPDICDTRISSKETLYGGRRLVGADDKTNHINFDKMRNETSEIITRQKSQLLETIGLMDKQQSQIKLIESELSVKNELELNRILENKRKQSQIDEYELTNLAFIVSQTKLINEFIQSFTENNSRMPTDEEITVNMEDSIDNDILLKFLII